MSEIGKVENILKIILSNSNLLDLLLEFKKLPLISETEYSDIDSEYVYIDRSIHNVNLEGKINLDEGIDTESFNKLAKICLDSVKHMYSIDQNDTIKLLSRISNALELIQSSKSGEDIRYNIIYEDIVTSGKTEIEYLSKEKAILFIVVSADKGLVFNRITEVLKT
jgi:hypothetical protein